MTWLPGQLKHWLSSNDSGVWGEEPDGHNDVEVLRSTDISLGGQWKIADPAVRSLPAIDRRRKVLREGDLVVVTSSGSEAHLGKTAIVSAAVAARSPCFANFVQRLRPAQDADARYIRYFLGSSQAKEELAALGNTTTGLRNLNGALIGSVSFPGPPLSEQRAIADYLDAETARIDALIAKKRQLVLLLEERIVSLVFQGVSGQLTSVDAPTRDSGLDWLSSVPTHFGVPTVGANFATQLGKMLNAEAAAGENQHRYVKNTNVKWDSFDLSDLPTMAFDAEDRARCELRAGDLLVCEGGEVGRAAIWPGADEPIYFQKALHRVRPLRDANTRFLMYCLWVAASLDVFSVEGNQATIVHLTGEKLREHRFPWPPTLEQQEIVRRIDDGRRRIGSLKERVTEQIDLLAEHRQALITSAVTGELLVPRAS